jgi:hypothetical protein
MLAENAMLVNTDAVDGLQEADACFRVYAGAARLRPICSALECSKRALSCKPGA